MVLTPNLLRYSSSPAMESFNPGSQKPWYCFVSTAGVGTGGGRASVITGIGTDVAVGLAVGTRVGMAVGVAVGIRVDTAVGLAVGIRVGAAVGPATGAGVCNREALTGVGVGENVRSTCVGGAGVGVGIRTVGVGAGSAGEVANGAAEVGVVTCAGTFVLGISLGA